MRLQTETNTEPSELGNSECTK